MQTTVTAAAAAAAQDREEEAPEFPPPPAYYRLFAPPPASATATAGDGMAAAAAVGAGGEEQEAEREEEAGEEEGSFPLPPPALPRRGQRVEMFGFPLAFLDEEHYDPIVASEARLYPIKEAVTHDNDGGGAGGSNAGEGARVAVVELDYRKELKRLHALLTETILALFSALCTTDSTSSTAEQQQPRPHLELLGKAVQLVDNMHDALSAYRQHQTLVQLVERMEAQCQEKRAVIQRLRSQIAESQQAADGASTGLVAALTALVGGGEDDGMVS